MHSHADAWSLVSAAAGRGRLQTRVAGCGHRCGGGDAPAAAPPALAVAEPPAPKTSPKDEILASIDKFTALRSYHASMHLRGGAQGETANEVDFVAPDRFRMETPMGTQVIIGDTMYMRAQGRTMQVPLPAGTLAQWRDPGNIARRRREHDRRGARQRDRGRHARAQVPGAPHPAHAVGDDDVARRRRLSAADPCRRHRQRRRPARPRSAIRASTIRRCRSIRRGNRPARAAARATIALRGRTGRSPLRRLAGRHRRPRARDADPASADAHARSRPVITSPSPGDEVKTTTCYMCACRCGIKVWLADGRIRYIQGNPEHPVNRGVLCAKGSAGIMQHYSPARLRKPLLRVGERGSGEFREIEWDEALELATDWLAPIRARNPDELAFFTGRDQSQALTGWWAQQFGTVNYAAHGGFCSVNMAAGGLYTLGGSFWEFGEPDWEHTQYLMLWGVAEDHDSNPIKLGLGKLKARGAKIVAVNPVRTRLWRDRRRVDRHPSRHRRPVRVRADPRTAAQRPHRPRLPGALRQCALAGAAQSRRRRRRPVRARRGRASRCAGTATGDAAVDANAIDIVAGGGRRLHPRRWPQSRCRCSSCSPNATSIRSIRPMRSANAAASPPTPSAASPANWPQPPSTAS